MKIKSIICVVIIIICSVFTLGFYSKLIDSDSHFNSPEYKGIITLWQIDSFEGGTGSRRQFLLKVAREYERRNQGVLIMVIDHTFESVKEAVKKGECPDLISYGNGVDILEMQPLLTDKFFKGGALNKTQYLIPWCRGGYCIITKGENQYIKGKIIDKILLSKTEYNQPALALSLEGVRANEYVVKSPLDAYVDFVGGKAKYLLGTQRDVIRLQNRGVDFSIFPLTEYNDLYQYMGITTSEQTKVYYARDFINYLLSSAVQRKLDEIGMLSCFDRVEYQSEKMSTLQDAKQNYTLSAFTDKDSLGRIHDLAINFLKGDKECEIKIKNMLI